jgi:hypothetical protein
MHLTAPSHWSQSIGTGGRDASERVVTIVVTRRLGERDHFWHAEIMTGTGLCDDKVIRAFIRTRV